MTLKQKILTFKKTHTLKDTAYEFNLSVERVRQIWLTIKQKRCKVHDRLYYNRCSYCLSLRYRAFLRWQDYNFIDKECRKESKKRDWLSVRKRIYLIEILHKKYHKSFTQIALMLKKDQSTIRYLYKKHATRR